MAKIKYIEHEGTEHVVDVPDGLSVMEGAVRFTVPGIDGDCGGACACATCHVYVDEADLARLQPQEPDELELLPLVAAERTAQSRLSCQIVMSEELAGLTVRIPERQHAD